MTDHHDTALTCDECANAVKESDDYCQNCGAMFTEEFHCDHHHSRDADGVCVICKRPFCDECGARAMNVFFCRHHCRYEFHEGMAQVFKHTESVLVQHAFQRLQQAGFHPLLFSRRLQSGVDATPWIPFRMHTPSTIGDLRVLVPFSEVLDAEKSLRNHSLFSL
jgi:hypothetical protein